MTTSEKETYLAAYNSLRQALQKLTQGEQWDWDLDAIQKLAEEHGDEG